MADYSMTSDAPIAQLTTQEETPSGGLFGAADDDEWAAEPAPAPQQRRVASGPPPEIKYIEPPAATTMADLPTESAEAFSDESKLWVGWHDGMTYVGPFSADVDMPAVLASFPFRANEETRKLLKTFPFFSYETRFGYNWMLLSLAVKQENVAKLTEEEKELGMTEPPKPDGYVLYETLNEWSKTLGRTPIYVTK